MKPFQADLAQYCFISTLMPLHPTRSQTLMRMPQCWLASLLNKWIDHGESNIPIHDSSFVETLPGSLLEIECAMSYK
ncbi:hypothetical protein TNCT_416471 [Trichonephila clavata]|uniref:Uncharacterized protein n=1 Tax=Trichonephila clavata TaxID=2740835 RepID=A0A8X6J0L0_TRICU|nr:hypothetical protein TNCT_416471 [Trichonephila clavata]